MSDFSTKAPSLAKRLSEELDNDLQDRLADSGWSQVINVTSKEGVINLSYDSFQESSLFESEYGSERVSPNAVVRPFLSDSEGAVKQAIEQEAIEFLFSEGVLP